MYSTAEVSTILEVNERTVRYYISQGHLKATLDGGNYQISIKDLNEFEDNYFDTKRFSNRGNGKRLDKNEFENLTAFIESVKSGMTLQDLIKDYQKLELKIPSLEVYLRHKRNEEIKSDKSKGMTYLKLSQKYGVCKKTISNILNEQPQGLNA